MARTFLFLELLDPEVNIVLLRLKEILMNRKFHPPLHLTLRGPYEGPLPSGALERFRQTMKYDVIRIAGVGRFRNPEEEVVYMKVDSSHLREVWWKPDFPIGTYGFEPHLSLYRGSDARFADLVAGFLASQAIELLCAEHRVVAARTRQYDLLSGASTTASGWSRLVEAGRIPSDLVERLEEMVGAYRGRAGQGDREE